MIVYKCDRCRAISEESMRPDWRRYAVRDENKSGRIMDLCEDCYQVLVDFVLDFDEEVKENVE